MKYDTLLKTILPSGLSVMAPRLAGSRVRELLSVEVSGLSFHPVSTAVNKVANDGPELVEPLVL